MAYPNCLRHVRLSTKISSTPCQGVELPEYSTLLFAAIFSRHMSHAVIFPDLLQASVLDQGQSIQRLGVLDPLAAINSETRMDGSKPIR